jgi:hypothetical protein
LKSNSQSVQSHRRFVVVMFLSFVLGMAVALAVYFLWRTHPAGFQHLSTAAALVVCPPFVLSYAIGATPDSAFVIVLGVGTIVFANACLYAGVAAGIYAVLTMRRKKKR